MKNLYIIRHGKSSWDMPLADELRPLTKRGINDAHLIGNALKVYDLPFLNVYVSVSKRTQETFEIIESYINERIETKIVTKELYTFSKNELINFLKKLPNNQNAILIFGHNFALTDFVNDFGSKAIENLPTCGFVHLYFDIDSWQQLHKGQTVKTLFPKELK